MKNKNKGSDLTGGRRNAAGLPRFQGGRHSHATYRKVVGREIRLSISRFLAIFAIVALGVGFLAGLLGTTPNMHLSADRYYDDTNMMDLRVLSSLGLSDDDIAALRDTEGVAGVMPGYTADVLLDNGQSNDMVARIHSLPLDKLEGEPADMGYQNRIGLTAGRYPEKAGEVVVLNTQYGSGVRLGETFTVSAENKDLSETLDGGAFTVVGMAESSYYLSVERESSTVGNGHISLIFFAGEDNFAFPAFTDAFVLVQGAKEKTAFTDAYDDAVDTVQKKLETLGETQASVRYADVKKEAQEKLDEGRNEYDAQKAEADRKLADARRKLDDGKAQLEKGEKQLADSKKTLEKSKKQLADGRKQLADGEKQLADQKAAFASRTGEAQDKLDAGSKELAAGRDKLDDAKAGLDDARKKIDEAEQTIAYLLSIGKTEEAAAVAAQLAQQKPVYEAGLAAYEEQAAFFTQKTADLKAGQDELNAGKATAEKEFAAAEHKLADSRRTVTEGAEALARGELEMADAEKKLAGSRTELTDGETEYAASKKEADEKLADAKREIDDAQKQIDDIEEPEWYVLDRHTNVSYVSFESNAEKVAAIAKIFPVFFFLVAALVALTTMTRMVEEERTQIGTLKALGYTNGAIAFKFLLYAGSATLLGSVFGLLVGFKVFPTVIWNAYTMLYTLPPLVTAFQMNYALLSSLTAILCTMLATLGACVGSLRERPARLMLPRAPKAGRRIFLEHVPFVWKRMKFTHKVTARNLLRYKKRFFMTITGIAGCTALLVTGFGLRDSISDIIGKQFGELYQYNLTVGLKNEEAVRNDDALRTVLENKQTAAGFLGMQQETGDLIFGGKTVSATLNVPEDGKRLPEFNILRNRKSGETVEFTDDKVLITEKQAERLGVSAGDTLDVKNADGKTGAFVVGGVIENYFQGALFIPPALYEQVYGQSPAYTTLLVKVPDATPERRNTVSAALLKSGSVQSVSFTNDIEDSFSNMLGSINSIVVLLIISAAALAFVVLYNLTNINITERQKELATIKVLGFYDREVSAYIYRETAILTIVGGALGLLLGIFLHAFVVKTAEVDMVMFGREIKWLSYVLSFAMTLFFSALVNIVMGHKMKKIDMVESMKAGE